MMMQMNQKKVAMMIVKGLGSKEASGYKPKEDVAMKPESEDEMSPEEAVAQELMDALASKDAKAVVESMKALMEMCAPDGSEQVDSSPES